MEYIKSSQGGVIGIADSIGQSKACMPNYEQEYYRHREEIAKLHKENEQLKDALLKLALRL